MAEARMKQIKEKFQPIKQTQCQNSQPIPKYQVNQDITQSSFINLIKNQDNLKLHLKIRYFTILLLLHLTYLVYYLFNSLMYSLPFIFALYQGTILVISFAISLLVFVSVALQREWKLPSRWAISTPFCLLYLSLILTNSYIVGQILDEPYQGMELSVVPGLAVSISFHFEISSKNSQFSVFLNIVLAVLFTTSIFCFSENMGHSFAQSFILISCSVYYIRKDQLKISKIQNQSEPSHLSQDKNCLQKAVFGIHSAVKQLKILAPFVPVSHYSEIFLIHQNLQQVRKILVQSPNIYCPDIEVITKNMSEQQKVFIKQALIFPDEKDKLQSKALLRTTVELIPNTHYNIQDLQGILSQIGKNWNFDMFFFNQFSDQKPLRIAGKFLINKFRIDEVARISQTTIQNFMKDLEQNYLDNPYHNSLHATEVMSSFLFFVTHSELKETINSLELLACILANLGHDVGHPGVMNRYLVNTSDPIAIKYNDISVLQSMHSSLIFEILLLEKNNILQNFEHSQYLLLRKIVIELVLSTDMGKHFQLLGQYKVKSLNQPLEGLENDEYRLDTLKIAIKAADVSHAAKTRDLHQMWSFRVIEEFFKQGDLEKAKGLKVSMFCDRNCTDISKSQSGFIKNIVLPIYLSLNSCLGSTDIEEECVEELYQNIIGWEDFGQQFGPKRKNTTDFLGFDGIYDELFNRIIRKRKGGTFISNSSMRAQSKRSFIEYEDT